MAYNAGRGFYGNQAIGNQTTLGQLAAMNRADFGFEDFYKGRTELGAGNAFDYDWRTIARPDIKKGQGPLGMPTVPSPMRGAQKLAAASTPGMTRTQYARWNQQVGQNMTFGGFRRDPHTGKAMEASGEGAETMPWVAGSESAPDYVKRRSDGAHRATNGSSTTRIRRASTSAVPGMATSAFGQAVVPGTPAEHEASTLQSLTNLAGDIESRAPGAVGRGVAEGVRKIGSGNVSTIPGAIGAVVGSTARSVGAAAVGKVGDAVKSRWAGSKAPGTQFPEPPPDPFA